MPVSGGWDSSRTNALARNNANASNKQILGPSTYGVSVSGYDAYPIGGVVGISGYVSASMGGNQVYPGWETSVETW